mgnify:FL=1
MEQVCIGGQETQAMEKRKSGQSKLYAAMLKIGFIGFGGGSALIPVIEQEVVDQQKLVSKEDYDKDVIVASITPGALPMEIAAGIGKQCYGVKGMFGAALAMSFPGALLTLLFLTVLNAVENVALHQISFLSIGLTAFISCMLTGYIIKTIKEAFHATRRQAVFTVSLIVGVIILTIGKSLYQMLGLNMEPLFALSTIQVLALAFFIVFYTRGVFNLVNIPVTAVLVALFLCSHGNMHLIQNKWVDLAVNTAMIALASWGFLRSLFQEETKKVSGKKLGREVGSWILFAVICALPALWVTKDSLFFMLRGIFSSLISFGGGDAYLIVADGLMVDTGMITEDIFYGKIVPMVNLLPGSILCKTLTGIGYYIGYAVGNSHINGVFLAILGYASSVAASGGVFCLGHYVFQRFKNLNIFLLLSKMIKPIISGLLVTVILSLIRQSAAVEVSAGMGAGASLGVMLVTYLIGMTLIWKKKCSNAVVVGTSAVFSLIACNILALL